MGFWRGWGGAEPFAEMQNWTRPCGGACAVCTPETEVKKGSLEMKEKLPYHGVKPVLIATVLHLSYISILVTSSQEDSSSPFPGLPQTFRHTVHSLPSSQELSGAHPYVPLFSLPSVGPGL